jgi:peptidyl-prolyl cis-trans isomerase SurA
LLKFNTLCAVVALVAAPIAVADELSDTGEFIDGVAAIVNEGVVLKSQLSEQMAVISQRAQEQEMQLPPADVLEEQVLERLILSEIQLTSQSQGLRNRTAYRLRTCRACSPKTGSTMPSFAAHCVRKSRLNSYAESK